MPRERIETVYKFDELDERAKERAREWYREGALDYEWWDFVYEDADKIAEILGISIDNKRGGPAIWFNGFYHQGSGSAFDGNYRYAKGCVEKIEAYAPKDGELHIIARELRRIQARHFYRLRANISSDRDSSIRVEVYDDEHPYKDLGRAEEDLRDVLRDFNGWIFQRLEKEYEYLMSDESVDEMIKANEYEFDEEGNIA